MPEPDKKRDEQFKKDIEKGLSIKQLSQKYGVSLRQISRLKKKLREKPIEVTSTLPSTATSTSTKRKRMTFWLPVDTIETIKRVAARERRTASAILREILRKYLKNK